LLTFDSGCNSQAKKKAEEEARHAQIERDIMLTVVESQPTMASESLNTRSTERSHSSSNHGIGWDQNEIIQWNEDLVDIAC